ncbi:Flp family type IVb pilin [Orbus wheelerorum]|uniref:Flp family type IVb pilin n=1 Tax=Orbus wheelerorum TaxID=3074111 RepID=UPI00370D347A
MKLSTPIRKYIQKFVKNEAGVTAIEYAIVAAGVASIVIVVFKASTGGPVFDMIDQVFKAMKTKVVGIIQ